MILSFGLVEKQIYCMHYTVILVTLNAVLSELITVITFDEMSQFKVVLMEVYVRRRNGCLCLEGT